MKRRNLKLLIEYDGTNYCGWQSQDGHQVTVQETITKVLKKITGERIVLYGASRTDGGVHALGQVANFYSRTKLPTARLRKALNGSLPPDIVVRKVEEVADDFHAQFAARAKTYCYTIINGPVPSALNRYFAYFVSGTRLNLKAMKQAARYLVGTHDFRAFASASRESFVGVQDKRKNYHRKIYSITMRRHKGVIRLTFRGSGFLYNMIRTIVGTLLWVGTGKIKPEEVKKIRESADRTKAGPNAPPRGLCLLKIEY